MNAARRNQLLYFVVAIALGIVAYREIVKQRLPVPGSVNSARAMAINFVETMHKVNHVEVNETPIIQENTALIKTVYGDNTVCTVKLIRTESQKEYGWLVESTICESVKNSS